MKCFRCQQDNPPHAKFCLECGAPFKGAHASDQPPPSYADLQHALTEAFEQQAATSEILRVISRSPADVQPVFDAIADSAARLCEASDAEIYVVEGTLYRRVAHRGPVPIAGPVGETYPITRGRPSSRAIIDRQTVHVHNQAAEIDMEFPDLRAWQQVAGVRTILATPLLRDGTAIGVIGIRRTEVKPFTERHIALLQTFADQAVIAIENVRLFQELEARNRELTESLEQQTATAEILRVISSSPTDLQPVLDAVAENAGRVCGAVNTSIYRLEDQSLRLVARHGPLPRALAIGDAVPLSRETVAGRVVDERRTIHVEDLLAVEAEYPVTVSRMRRGGHVARTMLVTPLLREGIPLGVILINRGPEVRPFSAKQVALLETFADQAVIAIENVRLFTELETKNRDLTEALEQQTATGEILRVISRSPTDVQPVFDAVAANAARLCGVDDVTIHRVEDGRLRRIAHVGNVPVLTDSHLPLLPGGLNERVLSQRRTVHVPDTHAPSFASEFPGSQHAAMGTRSLLATPLVRDGAAIGLIQLRRSDRRPFTDKQIALLETFADQAVIAIENVRLFRELQARNAELTEALGQQTATAEILRVMSGSPTDIQPTFEAIAASATRLCAAVNSLVIRFDGRLMHVAAFHNVDEGRLNALQQVFPQPPGRGSLSGRAILTRAVSQSADITNDPEYALPAQTTVGYRSAVAVPMLREGGPIGAILVARDQIAPFSEKEIELLKMFADQAVIAIENVRLFQELEARNRELTETLEQQTATAEILRVIASSPTDLGPVMQAVAENAARVCGAADASISLLEGERARLVTHHGSLPRIRAIGDTFPLSRDYVTGRAMVDRRTIHVEDILAAEAEFPDFVFRMRQAGIASRTLLATPLLREGTPLGAIIIARPEVHPFSPKQIALLETFANQAVIAIENVRLFQELRARTAELTQSVAQLTALGEVGRAVSSTLDVEAVLETIVSRASLLAGADACTIYEYDDTSDQFHLRATHNLDPEIAESMRATPLRKGEGVLGRAAALRQPVQVSDISRPGAYQSSLRDALIRAGYRAALSVPLLREDQIIGSLSLARKTPGEFSPEVIELLKTFATQSALAIQNARLFREIADKSRQLETASRHKSEFLASMSHELRTPLNAILGFNEMILGEIYGELSPDLREPLTDIQNSGKHLLRLINNVLDLSKIEAGRMELAPTDYAVQDLVERVRASLHPLAVEKGLEFVASVPEDIPLAYGDAGRITQCLMNLAGNALKFTRQGRVGISVAREGDRVVYRVSDTGIGIAKDKLESLFTEFRQGDATVASEFGGTGLGLSITKKFVEMHGGRIWVASEPGKGSLFSFEIPLRLAGGRTV